MDSLLAPEEIQLQKGPIWHGTAIGWHKKCSSLIQKIPVVSPRFSGILMKNPNVIAYSVYLPTSGHDQEFSEVLDALANDIVTNIPDEAVILVGLDANTSDTSSARRKLSFESFKNQFNLETILPNPHVPTFHHNNGISATQLDHLLTNSRESLSFDQIFCQLENPSNLSGHDAIIGAFKFNHVNQANDSTDYAHTYEDFNPKRVLWKENEMYENLTYDVLSKLLNCFDQPEHLPCLAEMFSNMIVMCAEKCYQFVEKKGIQI